MKKPSSLPPVVTGGPSDKEMSDRFVLCTGMCEMSRTQRLQMSDFHAGLELSHSLLLQHGAVRVCQLQPLT